MSRVLVSGAGGFVGRALVPALVAGGYDVRRLVRVRPRDPGEFRWGPAAGVIDPAALEGADVVVHLAGANIGAGRWTTARKAEILESRRAGTRLVAEAMCRAVSPPRLLLCASGVGFYGDRGDESLTESSSAGTGFLAEVARVWEAEAAGAARSGARVVSMRHGLVLDRSAPALARIAFPYRMGLGGPLGDGRQWLSWITRHDLVRAVQHLITTEGVQGPVNFVAPGAVTQEEFSRALARALNRPNLFRVPRWVIAALLGDMGRELLLASQRVVPERLLASGFVFEHCTIDGALHFALRRIASRHAT